jgi:hypothetical protein
MNTRARFDVEQLLLSDNLILESLASRRKCLRPTSFFALEQTRLGLDYPGRDDCFIPGDSLVLSVINGGSTPLAGDAIYR